MKKDVDFLVIGSGLAGLTFALKMATNSKVLVLSKKRADQTNTQWAQGGIACVTNPDDSFSEHVKDTLIAGAGLSNQTIVEKVVSDAPCRIQDLIKWGVEFDLNPKKEGELDQSLALTLEGGHGKRRILHHHDQTGQEIQIKLLQEIKKHPNIVLLENHFAIDLLIDKKIDTHKVGESHCIGAYVLNANSGEIFSVKARATILATGGAGKIYLYTTNWEGATGDGIAMAFRAGARVANLEFMQFHPTCLFHPEARNFLISEALRGEGAELVNKNRKPFMKKYHSLGSLAPRDIVARSIDNEMKKTGAECVYLDITHKDRDFLQSRFPAIFEKCLQLGIDMSQHLIPVVPAAHYLCGGVYTDSYGRTDVNGLFAVGETACTGLHGANRLASNSLLECAVFGASAAEYISQNMQNFPLSLLEPKPWKMSSKSDADELILISHMWDEIRRLMWNYVGIVRTNKRLQRAMHRLQNLQSEIREYYWDFKVHPDILELRNIALVAELSVRSALKRKESRGIHYNLDYPETLPEATDSILDR